MSPVGLAGPNFDNVQLVGTEGFSMFLNKGIFDMNLLDSYLNKRPV